MINQAIGQSHAKIILMGEHSVVYGKPAIALPISSVNIKATVQEITHGQKIQCKYFIGAISRVPANMLGIQRLIISVLRSLHQTRADFLIQITSTIPSARGMGSSAATAVAVTRALFRFFQEPLTHSQLLKISNIEEKITHGNPSGIDAATASSRFPVYFIPGQPIRSVPIHLDGALVIADSGIKGRTDIAVNSVHQMVVNHPTISKSEITALGQLANDAKHRLASNQISQLGKDMNQSQTHLARLGVSTSILNHLITVARQAGAYGAKLTGSGLGGCIIALAQNAQAPKVARALINAGAVGTWIQPFHTSGRTTVHEEH